MLQGLRVVSLALNLPGPAACSRLRDMGAAVAKVEPPSGDPMRTYCAPWYAELHRGVEVRALDLKQPEARAAFAALLRDADVLVTAQRPQALARLGLDADALRTTWPQLCTVRITGHAPPHDDVAGHDLTYLARHGLVDEGRLPPTLFADMAGAERVVSTVLALLHARQATGHGGCVDVALEDAAAWLALPRRFGLTTPGALLGGALPGYHLYAARDGWIAVAALEPHFAQRLAEAFDLPALDAAALTERFGRESAAHWEAWALERDLPLVALRHSPTQDPS